MSEKRFYVYGLFEPKSNKIDNCFYIGKGTRHRVDCHFQSSHLEENSSEKARKILSLQSTNRQPYSRKLFSNLCEEKAFRLEAKIINTVGLKNLTNQIDGGRRTIPNSQYRQKLSKALSGRTLSEKHKKRIADSRKGDQNWVKNEEVRKKISETLSGRSLSEERKQKISESLIGREFSEDVRNKIRQANKGEGGSKAKLDNRKVAEIKWLILNTYLTDKEISKEYDVSSVAINKIRDKQTWNHVDIKKPNNKKLKGLDLVKCNRNSFKYEYVKKDGRSSQLNLEEVKEVVWLVQNTESSQNYISELYDVSQSSISRMSRKDVEAKKPKFV